jgi:L-malate glycosyltransferase
VKLLYLMTEPFGIGGVQSDILALTRGLTSSGHVVYVATTPGVLLDELKTRGARHVDIDFHFRGPRGLWRAARALRRLVREEGIELVAPQSVRSAVAAYLSMRLLGGKVRRIPLVVTIHNIHTPLHFRYAGRILRRCADYVIFESNYERRRVIASGLPEAKSCVIHSGIDLERFAPRKADPALEARFGIDPARHFVYGIVARLSEEKGHRYLVSAFAKVVRDLPQSRLMIVGEGPLLEEVRRQVRDLNLEDSVIFTGMQRDIPAFLAMMKVFVLASTRESFPLSAREAMASGLAVIAPDIGGCGEVVEDGVTGLLFPAADSEALADKMRRLAGGDLARQYGRAGFDKAHRLYSGDNWVSGDEKVYLRFAGI